MEEYLIFVAIGGLIFLTLIVNSVSEAYEQKQREKRIKILKIKQGLEELSHLLERLKGLDIANDIRDLLLNEIMARLQAIQRLDRHFRGIQALIEEASEEAKQAPSAQAGSNIKDESQFKQTMVMFRQLLKWLSTNQWYSRVTPTQLKTYSQDVKLLRCEKIFQFYADRASQETEQKNYLVAKEHYHYILHALRQSGISSNPRIVELIEQAEFMIGQISQTISDKVKKIVNDENSKESSENDEQEEQPEQTAQADIEKSSETPPSSPEQATATPSSNAK